MILNHSPWKPGWIGLIIISQSSCSKQTQNIQITLKESTQITSKSNAPEKKPDKT